MKRRYEVEARWYVMDKNELQAQIIKPPDILACSVFAIEPAGIDTDWYDAIPFNSDDDRTCGEILSNQKIDAQVLP